MGLVKDYGISTTDEVNCTVNFSIPSNCDYIMTSNSGKYYITVTLKRGQTTPSPIFVPCTATAAMISDVADVQFQQVLSGITSNRPKVKIDNCM